MLTWTRPQTLQSQGVLWEEVLASICRCLVHVGQRETLLSLKDLRKNILAIGTSVYKM